LAHSSGNILQSSDSQSSPKVLKTAKTYDDCQAKLINKLKVRNRSIDFFDENIDQSSSQRGCETQQSFISTSRSHKIVGNFVMEDSFGDEVEDQEYHLNKDSSKDSIYRSDPEVKPF